MITKVKDPILSPIIFLVLSLTIVTPAFSELLFDEIIELNGSLGPLTKLALNQSSVSDIKTRAEFEQFLKKRRHLNMSPQAAFGLVKSHMIATSEYFNRKILEEKEAFRTKGNRAFYAKHTAATSSVPIIEGGIPFMIETYERFVLTPNHEWTVEKIQNKRSQYLVYMSTYLGKELGTVYAALMKKWEDETMGDSEKMAEKIFDTENGIGSLKLGSLKGLTEEGKNEVIATFVALSEKRNSLKWAVQANFNKDIADKVKTALNIGQNNQSEIIQNSNDIKSLKKQLANLKDDVTINRKEANTRFEKTGESLGKLKALEIRQQSNRNNINLLRQENKQQNLSIKNLKKDVAVNEKDITNIENVLLGTNSPLSTKAKVQLLEGKASRTPAEEADLKQLKEDQTREERTEKIMFGIGQTVGGMQLIGEISQDFDWDPEFQKDMKKVMGAVSKGADVYTSASWHK